MTTTEISRLTSAGTKRTGRVGGAGAGRRSHMRLQSIARRKQTTANPENSPMKTDKMRKKRSSRKPVLRKKRRDPRVWTREGSAAVVRGMRFMGGKSPCRRMGSQGRRPSKGGKKLCREGKGR